MTTLVEEGAEGLTRAPDRGGYGGGDMDYRGVLIVGVLDPAAGMAPLR